MSTDAFATVRFKDTRKGLHSGALLGRGDRADLQIEHPAVSEVHAYVSLRDGVLLLLPLRGQLRVHGMVVEEVVLEPRMRVQLADDVFVEVEAVQVAPAAHGTESTVGGGQPSIWLQARFDTVLVERRGQEPTVVTGTSARILTILAEIGLSGHWAVVAGELWPRISETATLRRRWDKALRRLRDALGAADLGELIHVESGQITLVLRARDVVSLDFET